MNPSPSRSIAENTAFACRVVKPSRRSTTANSARSMPATGSSSSAARARSWARTVGNAERKAMMTAGGSDDIFGRGVSILARSSLQRWQRVRSNRPPVRNFLKKPGLKNAERAVNERASASNSQLCIREARRLALRRPSSSSRTGCGCTHTARANQHSYRHAAAGCCRAVQPQWLNHRCGHTRTTTMPLGS